MSKPNGLLARFQFRSSRQECRIKERIVTKLCVTSKLRITFFFHSSYYEVPKHRQTVHHKIQKEFLEIFCGRAKPHYPKDLWSYLSCLCQIVVVWDDRTTATMDPCTEFLNPKESELILHFFTKQINPRSLGPRSIKETKRIHFQSGFFLKNPLPEWILCVL